MDLLLRGGLVACGSEFKRKDILIADGVVSLVGEALFSPDAEVIDITDKYIFPGFADVHVHFREPGFSYKETIASGAKAAARGGYTAVCTMPNLDPVPDCAENLRPQLEKAAEAAVSVLPYGAITVGEKGEELADMDALAPLVCAFSDDGKGVQSAEMMERAMRKARSLGKIIAAHCEDESLLHGGVVHDGGWARAHGYAGICSESEWRPIARDVELAKKTGCAYHVCHVSTKESVEIIRRAKAEGADVTCETAPHYLTLCDEDMREEGRFKMNPPLRSAADREALLQGLLDGTIDMIATDHAPHSAEEKSRGLNGSPMGVVGLETAFAVLYTRLVLTGKASLALLVQKLCTAPRARFNLGGGAIEVGARADLTVFDLDKEYEINPDDFLSKGRATPFAGERVRGECILTIAGGKTAWRK